MHRNVHLDHALDQIASDNDTLSKEQRRKVLRDNLLLSEGTAARVVAATTTLRTKQSAVALGAASVLLAPQMTGVAAASENPAPDVTPMEDATPDAEAVAVPTVEDVAPVVEDVAPVVEDVVPVVEDAAETVTDVVVEEAEVDATPPIGIPEEEEDESPLPVPDITPEDEGATGPEPDEPDGVPDWDQPESDDPVSDAPEPEGPAVGPGNETPPEDADSGDDNSDSDEDGDDESTGPLDGVEDVVEVVVEVTVGDQDDETDDQDADDADSDAGDDTTPQNGTPLEPVSDVVEEVVEEAVPAVVEEVVDEGIVEDAEDVSGPVAAPPAPPPPPAAPPPPPAAPAAPPVSIPTTPARPESSPTTSQRPVTPSPTSSPVEIPSGGSSVDPIEPPTTATAAPEIVRVDPIPSPQAAEALQSRPARPTSNDVRIVRPAIDPRGTPIRQTVVSLDERIRQAQSRPVDTVRVGDWSRAVVDAWTAMQSGRDADDTGVLAFDEIAESPTLGWSYQVQAGDSLWTISEALWGTSDLTSTQISETWQLLYTWNADQIGSNPDSINAGTVIQLPIDTGADA